MKRVSFLTGLLAGVVGLFTFKPKPIKADENEEDLCECCDELECDCGTPDTTCPDCQALQHGYRDSLDHKVLWPNSAQFPCEKNSSFADRECASCRLVYNGRVKDSDPIRYKQVRVSQMTGKWYWEGDASTWEEFDDRVANKIFGRLSNQQ